MSLARFFQRPHYTSDATDFLNQLKKEHPQMEANQRAGRARLWDRHLNRSELAQFKAARVPQFPYVYYHNDV